MKNRHIVSTLNDELLRQPFSTSQNEPSILSEYQHIARMYAKIESSIAVLSDLKANKSYIYNGGLAQGLGIADRESIKEINSIWEEDIFHKIHPEDLIEKHVLELHFFHLLKTLPIEERLDYHITSKMRMLNAKGDYIDIHHRMFYVCNCPLGNLWLAFCLYNYSYEKFVPETSNGMIINSVTGTIIEADKHTCSNILTTREKEILLWIEKGRMSKEIADLLSISKNTVDRHRQNILEKLRAKNSIEACLVGKRMGLL